MNIVHLNASIIDYTQASTPEAYLISEPATSRKLKR